MSGRHGRAVHCHAPEIVLDGLRFPEGAYWSARDRCLYFVEWAGDTVCRLADGRAEVVATVQPGDGPCGLAQDARGCLWLCLYSSHRVVCLDAHGRVQRTVDAFQDQALRGPNEIVFDGAGGLYFTDSGDFDHDWRTGRPAGAVYYLAPFGELAQVARDLCYPNGIALSLDGRRLVVNEHRRNRILFFDVHPSGHLGAKRVLANLDGDSRLDPGDAYELGPDGLWRDVHDTLWVPHYGGGRVIGLDAEGEVVARIPLPRGRKPTNTAVDEEAQVLYVTEAEEGLLYGVRLQRCQK
ncbi:MAG: SMP-30/gluconolactonase/LRE family protein [Anaerolineae bacterium]|nr:SMP-30/gluconolactonase/LRE family protein [Anaerolineae bacterium]